MIARQDFIDFIGEHMSEQDFIDFVSEHDAVVKPVVIDDELMGWIVWNGGHTLNFFNTDYEGTGMCSIGDFASDNVSFEEFLTRANDWIEEMKRERNDGEGEPSTSDDTR